MRRFAFLSVIMLLVALVRPSHGQPTRLATLENADAIPGELLVKFRPGRSATQQAAAVQPHGGTVVGQLPALDVAAVRFERLRSRFDPQATLDLIEALERTPGVELVEPNYRYRLSDGLPASEPEPSAVAEELDQHTHLPLVWNADISAFVPNDPYLSAQYGWKTIDAYQGWAIDHHYAGVVAVIDTGVDLDHPDLQAHLVDGYDFVDNDAFPDDGYGHGTHVAGTIAAVSDNGEGVAGTCPACLIMPIRIFDDWGYTTLYDVAQGITFAADHGAQVLNMSFGGFYSQIEHDAMDYAWQRGAVMVCSAGNSGTDDPTYAYPAADDLCIAVAASTVRDRLAWFSNYGPWVDIAAPGDGIYSTYPYDDYEWSSGTSMAAPHVAGAAGMLAGAGLNRDQIRFRLLTTADSVSGISDRLSGGRLNLHRTILGN